MNETLISNLAEFKEKALTASTYTGYVAALQIRDPVYCRTFPLESFYEFNEASQLDFENIDMTFQLNVLTDNEEFVTNLVAIRIVSHIGQYGLFDIINPWIDGRIIDITIPIVETFLKTIKARSVIVTGADENILKGFLKMDYKAIDRWKDQYGVKELLYKIL